MSRRVVVKLSPATCQRLAIELGTEDLDILVRVALENILNVIPRIAIAIACRRRGWSRLSAVIRQ